MKIRVYKCPKCEEEIYSRANHDFKYCKCGKSAVDDGHFNKEKVWVPYRLIGRAIEAETRVIEIDVDKETLHFDWNIRGKKYGVV